MFEFTEEDLKANKRGLLSPSQKEWLKSIAQGTRSFSWTELVYRHGLRVPGALYCPGRCPCKTNDPVRPCFRTP